MTTKIGDSSQPPEPPANDEALEALREAVLDAYKPRRWYDLGSVPSMIFLLVLIVVLTLVSHNALRNHDQDSRPWSITCFKANGEFAFAVDGTDPRLVAGGLAWDSATAGGVEGKFSGTCWVTRTTATP